MKVTYEVEAGGKQITEIVRNVAFKYVGDLLNAVCELPDRSAFYVPAHLLIEIEPLKN